MYYPGQQIVISSAKLQKDIVFDYCAGGRIESSWKKQTDTAQLTLPRRLKYGDKMLQDLIAPGDRITIALGYDGDLQPEFSGFITRIDARIPLGIYAEDSMYLFKRGSITQGWKSVNLETVIKHLADHYNSTYKTNLTYKTVNADLGTLRIKEATGSQVLQKIRDTYGFVAFFRDNQLNVGFPRSSGTNSSAARRVKYRFTENIIQSNLEFRTKEEVRIKIRAVSNFTNNKKETVEVGDVDGEVHTRNFFNVSKSKLKELAQLELDNARFDGYRGGFRTFGIPRVAHGDIAVLEDPDYPERAGSYFVDSVVTEFGIKGFKRNVELGQQAAAS